MRVGPIEAVNLCDCIPCSGLVLAPWRICTLPDSNKGEMKHVASDCHQSRYRGRSRAQFPSLVSDVGSDQGFHLSRGTKLHKWCKTGGE